MKKRDFIKSSLLAGVGLLNSRTTVLGAQNKRAGFRNWIWENPDKEESLAEIEKRYHLLYTHGIKGIFFEQDSEKHFRAAKDAGMEAHRWMWTLNRGEQEVLEKHPDWYAVSRNGKSCASDPPYVGYYRWLCPSRPEVLSYLKDQVREILEKEYVDGIHLDYIRFCDVILPVNLWANYQIVQDREQPEYDFCYCPVCRNKFSEWRGTDPQTLTYPDQSASWRKFRYDQVTHIVNQLSGIARQHHKSITAAVFPTPEIARRIVRQDWTNWDLDGICPMIYHGFYQEPVEWIGDAVEEGVHFLCDRFPLYAGLFLPDFKSSEELSDGIRLALQHGASGVSLFGKIEKQTLQVLKEICDQV